MSNTSATESANGSTLANLQAAFNGESNASNRYQAFAKKADQEGYAPVASLFRAASMAEKIHAGAHAQVIRKMGGEPKAVIENPKDAPTPDNLQAAIAGETYERDVMYPDFIIKAKAEKNTDAVQSFSYALAAEAEHAKLYKQALDNLAQWKGAAKAVYVCPICGYTALTLPGSKCPCCGNPRENFKAVQ